MEIINIYETPNFDVTIYEIDDIITSSGVGFGEDDPNGGEGWFG